MRLFERVREEETQSNATEDRKTAHEDKEPEPTRFASDTTPETGELLL